MKMDATASTSGKNLRPSRAAAQKPKVQVAQKPKAQVTAPVTPATEKRKPENYITPTRGRGRPKKSSPTKAIPEILAKPSSAATKRKPTNESPSESDKTTEPSKKRNIENDSEKESTVIDEQDPKPINKNPQHFTVVQKKSEASTQNGTTTKKSTFVIRGNGPLSPAQLEAILRANILTKGTVKDGAKVLVRHRSSNPVTVDEGKESIQSGAFVVKENKIVPMQGPEAAKLTNESNSQERTVVRLPTIPIIDGVPLFVDPTDITPEMVQGLCKTIKKQQLKVNRQNKLIEKLKTPVDDNNMTPKELARYVRKFLPGFAGKFFEAQLLTNIPEHRIKHGHRWDDDTKIFALGLWNRSPAAFKMMQEAFNLPSIKTLNNWVASIPPAVDFSDKLKEVLGGKSPELDVEVENSLKINHDANKDSDLEIENNDDCDDPPYPDEEEIEDEEDCDKVEIIDSDDIIIEKASQDTVEEILESVRNDLLEVV